MAKVRDMTKGRPLGLILRFCAPMVAGYILQQLYSMVDTVIVGRYLGLEALAGVGATGAVSFLVIGFATGICTGFSIPVAQRFGAGDYTNMRKNMANGFLLAGIVALVLTAVTMLLTGQILHLMKTPETIFPYAYAYIIVVFGGIAASILYNLLAAMLRAVGDSLSPLIFLAIASVLNILLDFFFILVLKSGVEGAGYATVISQGVSGLLCAFYLFYRYPMLRLKKEEAKPELKRCIRLLAISLPMALQFSITAIGSIIMQTSVNTLGDIAVMSVTAAQKIDAIVMGPLESIGLTMATYCGQNRGARKFSRIQEGIRVSLQISMVYSIFAIGFLVFCGRYTSYLFVDAGETQVLALAEQFMRLNGAFFPILGILFILRNGLQGMGYSLMPMCGGISELIARALVCIIFVPVYGFTAAALASPMAWVFAVGFLSVVYAFDMRRLRQELCGEQKAPSFAVHKKLRPDQRRKRLA